MSPGPAKKRSSCPIGIALDIFGDRWTLLILRDLILHGKARYREFLSSEEGIASNILSDRLRRLEVEGMVTRDRDEDDKRRVIYKVTPKGQSLVPVLLEIAAWGASQDGARSAPRRFADRFYQDRAASYESPRELLAESAAKDG